LDTIAISESSSPTLASSRQIWDNSFVTVGATWGTWDMHGNEVWASRNDWAKGGSAGPGRRPSSNRLRIAVLGGLIALAGGRGPGGRPAPPRVAASRGWRWAPSRVTGAVRDSALPKGGLPPEAEDRLKLVTASVERKPVPRAVSYGGDVMIP